MEVDGNNSEPVDLATAHLSRVGQARVKGPSTDTAQQCLVAGQSCAPKVTELTESDERTKEAKHVSD